MSEQKKHKGRIKFFNYEKSFGFVKDNLDGKELFIHKSNILAEHELRENDEVEFEVEQGKKGLQAVNVDFPA